MIRIFWLALFAIGAVAVLVFGWQGGEPFTAAAFVVFFSSRVARSIIKKPLASTIPADPVQHANRFLGVTAAGWIGAGALAAAAAFAGEGGEWLYVAPFFFVMGALQIWIMLWAGRAVAAPAAPTATRRALPWTAGALIVAALACAAWLTAGRPGPFGPRESSSRAAPGANRQLTYEVPAGRLQSPLSIRNLDSFAWTHANVVIGQADGHAYDCDTFARVPAKTVLTVDVQRCLSEDGVAADPSRRIASFSIRADEGFATLGAGR